MSTGRKVSTFKERFSTLFDESEKTIIELAKELHVSNQTVSAWKTGTRSPKEPTIIAIANHFGVKVDWLMGFDVPKDQTGSPIQKQDEEKPKNDDVRLLLQEMNRMTPEQIEQVKGMFRIMFKLSEKGMKEDDA